MWEGKDFSSLSRRGHNGRNEPGFPIPRLHCRPDERGRGVRPTNGETSVSPCHQPGQFSTRCDPARVYVTERLVTGCRHVSPALSPPRNGGPPARGASPDHSGHASRGYATRAGDASLLHNLQSSRLPTTCAAESDATPVTRHFRLSGHSLRCSACRLGQPARQKREEHRRAARATWGRRLACPKQCATGWLLAAMAHCFGSCRRQSCGSAMAWKTEASARPVGALFREPPIFPRAMPLGLCRLPPLGP